MKIWKAAPITVKMASIRWFLSLTPERLQRMLCEGSVEFIVLGGLAAAFHTAQTGCPST